MAQAAENTIREMWARQAISPADVDYERWEGRRAELVRMASLTGGCVFVVDVFRGVYDYISDNFVELFGVQPGSIEQLVHPDDRARLADLQIRHAKFIYSLPPGERNDYRTIYQVRMRGAGGRWINVVSRQQVIETTADGKAWMVMGIVELAPDQTPTDRVRCSVFNVRTGQFFNPYASSREYALTQRELEVLSLIGRGHPSKEIAAHLEVSKHTVDNHRKNILIKLEADNAIEAINTARAAGLID